MSRGRKRHRKKRERYTAAHPWIWELVNFISAAAPVDWGYGDQAAETTFCVHGRVNGHMCPHCMGLPSGKNGTG